MNSKSDDFKKLQAKWYKKLKNEGFNDIEQDEDNLKRWASSSLKHQFNEIQFEAKESYYRLARQFYHDHKFVTSLEKDIWKMHSDGISLREIATSLTKKGLKTNKDAVNVIIKRLSGEMCNKCR